MNPRPLRCERSALPTELAPHLKKTDKTNHMSRSVSCTPAYSLIAAVEERGGTLVHLARRLYYTHPVQKTLPAMFCPSTAPLWGMYMACLQKYNSLCQFLMTCTRFRICKPSPPGTRPVVSSELLSEWCAGLSGGPVLAGVVVVVSEGSGQRSDGPAPAGATAETPGVALRASSRTRFCRHLLEP